MTRELLDVSGCKKNLVIEIPPEVVEQQITELALEYSQKVQVPGFRPGKVPVNLIRQRYAQDLHKDAVQDIIARSWKEAVKDLNLTPLDHPSIEILQDVSGSPLKFSLSFEMLPELKIDDYKGVPVTVAQVEVRDEDVDKALESLKDRHAEYIPVESEPIHDGHLVSFSLDGEFIGGGKPIHEDEVTCVVGDSRTNETFSENLRGGKAGETRDFEVEYPEDYHRKQFAGKRVRYQAKIMEVKEKRLAELNDEFASQIGAENIEDLRQKIKDDLVTKAAQVAEKKAKEAVLDELIKRHTFDVPECLVEDELTNQTRRIAADLAYRGVDIERASIDWNKIREERKVHAIEAVRRSLILDAIARREDIETTEEELDAEIVGMAQGTGRAPAALRAQLEKDQKLSGLREHLRHNKALDFIYRNANISRG